MKSIIESLQEQLNEVKKQSGCFDWTGLEHGSTDQTRAMLFQSMFIQIECNINAAIRQAEILDRELF